MQDERKKSDRRGRTDKVRKREKGRRVRGTLGGEGWGRWVQESCKYGRETDFCGRSASGKEILDVRDVCFASRATTVQPVKGSQDRTSFVHFALYVR